MCAGQIAQLPIPLDAARNARRISLRNEAVKSRQSAPTELLKPLAAPR